MKAEFCIFKRCIWWIVRRWIFFAVYSMSVARTFVSTATEGNYAFLFFFLAVKKIFIILVYEYSIRFGGWNKFISILQVDLPGLAQAEIFWMKLCRIYLRKWNLFVWFWCMLERYWTENFTFMKYFLHFWVIWSTSVTSHILILLFETASQNRNCITCQQFSNCYFDWVFHLSRKKDSHTCHCLSVRQIHRRNRKTRVRLFCFNWFYRQLAKILP